MESKIIQRSQHKTSEGEFIYELQNLYELSPKMSELAGKCNRRNK